MVFSPSWHGKPARRAQKSPVNMANSCTSLECKTFLGGGSKNVSTHEPFQTPPILTAPLDTVLNPGKLCEYFELVIRFLSFILYIAIPIQTMGMYVHMAWVQNHGLDFGSPGHLSRFSFFTSNIRKTASISSGRAKLLISSSCHPESDGCRKNPLSIFISFKSFWRKGILWVNE